MTIGDFAFVECFEAWDTCDVIISSASENNTFVFEVSNNGLHWEPINLARIKALGPNLGNIRTCAVAGGPAHFTGQIQGSRFFRVVRTRSDGEEVSVRLTVGENRYIGLIDKKT